MQEVIPALLLPHEGVGVTGKTFPSEKIIPARRYTSVRA